MNDMESCLGLIFDDQGNEWSKNSFELRRRLYCERYIGDFEGDIVRNLGFISISISGVVSRIALNTGTVSSVALASCFYWLNSAPRRHIVIEISGDKQQTVLAHSSADATNHLNQLLARRFLSERLTAIDVSPASIKAGTPEAIILKYWSDLGERTPIAKLLPIVERVVGARYFAVKRTDAHQLVFDVVGSGIQVPDKSWIKSVIGRTVESQPDKECWEWAANHHHAVLDARAPKVTDIGAEIYWPSSGWVRRSYRRVLVPCLAIDGTVGVLSANCERGLRSFDIAA